jgi:hypothetical protein
MSKSSHPSTVSGNSQCNLILRELKRKKGQWVPMPRLVSCSGSYNVHSRIADCRRRGAVILHENKYKHQGRKVMSFYRLISL